MKGFIVYPTYRVTDDRTKALIYLFGRLENGESFLTINEYRPYFHIKTQDVEAAKKLVKADFEETENKNFNNDKLTKVIFNIPTDLKQYREVLENSRVKTYESDVPYVNRFLIDHEITSSLHIEGEFKKGQYVDRIYENPKLTTSDFIPKLKVLSIDIEASDFDAEKGTIYCISMYMGDYKSVLIVSNQKLDNAVSFPDEKSMLQAFRQKIIDLDPDILVGWNFIDFDLDYIKKGFDKYKIEFKLGRADWPCKLNLQESFFMDSKADFPGRQVLDAIQLMKSSFIKMPDYKLDTVASTVLGEKKLIGHENKEKDILEAYNHNQQKLVDYNLSDAKLVYDILEKQDLVNLTMLRSSLTGMPLDRVSASVASLDSLYLRMLKKHKIVANYAGAVEQREERAKGGFVMESVPGIYDYVIVCDFKSLYPSLIRTFNIDPYSFISKPEQNLDKSKFVRCANGAVFRNDKGFLPQIIERIWTQRDIAKKKKDATASYALKILMNSLYGALGNPSSRYYSLDISNAITHTGQMFIKLCAKKAEEKGYKVIYGDTDSLFILPGVSTVEEADKIGKNLVEEINVFLKNTINKEYDRESFMELQFEKVFKRFMMPKSRGTEAGSKKRYAGLLVKDGKEEITVTGMEFVRGDWCEAAKEFQYTLLDLIFHGKEDEVKKYIKDYVKDIYAGKMDSKLVLRKSIRKELEQYTKTTPPHVKAARKLPSINSSIIEYYIAADGEPYPAEMMKGRKIDYDYYIEKQIEPLADTVLSFYGQAFKDLIKGHTQKGLEGYF